MTLLISIPHSPQRATTGFGSIGAGRSGGRGGITGTAGKPRPGSTVLTGGVKAPVTSRQSQKLHCPGILRWTLSHAGQVQVVELTRHPS